MPSARKSPEQQLEALNALDLSNDPKGGQEALKAALQERHYRVVAKAAELAGERLFYALDPVLRQAYERFLDDPVKRDPNCLAKSAIARSLVALECTNAAFFLAGLRYTQMEPVWGGRIDTAIDVRNSCAMGLVASGYPRALQEVTLLLSDPEPRARQGAVRAIACGVPREAELLLRLKARVGDAEPEVIGDCFAGLLSVAPEHSVQFVATYVETEDEAISELAALALGESRLPEALTCLKKAWDVDLVTTTRRRALLRAAALHRSDAAFDWLLAVLAEHRLMLAEAALEALSIYKQNAQLATRIKQVLHERGERTLLDSFEKLWET